MRYKEKAFDFLRAGRLRRYVRPSRGMKAKFDVGLSDAGVHTSWAIEVDASVRAVY